MSKSTFPKLSKEILCILVSTVSDDNFLLISAFTFAGPAFEVVSAMNNTFNIAPS